MTETKNATPVTDAVREQRGDYIEAVEALERSHAELLAAARYMRDQLDLDEPTDWEGARAKLNAAIRQAEALAKKFGYTGERA